MSNYPPAVKWHEAAERACEISGVYKVKCAVSGDTFTAYFYNGRWYNRAGEKIVFGSRNWLPQEPNKFDEVLERIGNLTGSWKQKRNTIYGEKP